MMEGKSNRGFAADEAVDTVTPGKTPPSAHSTSDSASTVSKESVCERLTSCRWTMAYVCCLCYTLIYTMRTNMSIAIVCMVKTANKSLHVVKENITDVDTCGAEQSAVNQAEGGEIEWDKTTQGWILSAFFYGYLLTQIPAGILAGRFGGKRVMLWGVGLFGVSTVLVPVAARFDGVRHEVAAILVVVLRVISGASCGAVSPSIFSLLGKWIPIYERSKLTVITLSGQMFGSTLILGVGGFFCEWESFDGGWPSIFYMCGGLSGLFCIIWALTVFDSPSQHPRITEREVNYIQENTEHQISSSKNKSVPWLRIMTSPAMWAIIVAHMCFNFGHYAIMTKLPAYMKEVLNLDIKTNGLYSSLPHIAMFVVANFASNLIDKLRKNRLVSTVAARKIAVGLALVIPAGFLVAAGFIPCHQKHLGVVFLTIAVGFTGFFAVGVMPNHHDIAARYSGEIYGIGNMFATIPGIVAPVLVNTLTPNGTVEEWRQVFYVWASVYIFGAVFFAVFGRGETQDWARDDPDVESEECEGKLSDRPISTSDSSESVNKLSDRPISTSNSSESIKKLSDPPQDSEDSMRCNSLTSKV